jgi:hypothetical protein
VRARGRRRPSWQPKGRSGTRPTGRAGWQGAPRHRGRCAGHPGSIRVALESGRLAESSKPLLAAPGVTGSGSRSLPPPRLLVQVMGRGRWSLVTPGTSSAHPSHVRSGSRARGGRAPPPDEGEGLAAVLGLQDEGYVLTVGPGLLVGPEEAGEGAGGALGGVHGVAHPPPIVQLISPRDFYKALSQVCLFVCRV